MSNTFSGLARTRAEREVAAYLDSRRDDYRTFTTFPKAGRGEVELEPLCRDAMRPDGGGLPVSVTPDACAFFARHEDAVTEWLSEAMNEVGLVGTGPVGCVSAAAFLGDEYDDSDPLFRGGNLTKVIWIFWSSVVGVLADRAGLEP